MVPQELKFVMSLSVVLKINFPEVIYKSKIISIVRYHNPET